LEIKMSQIIQEMADQSTEDIMGVKILNKEKFAELIVKECAGVVADAVDHREPASTYVSKIKQHFGVEE